MKIAVFPGVFNPIHIAHIEIALNVISTFNIDKLIFVPTSDTYNKNHIINKEHRYNMLKIACENSNKIEVSRVEIEAGRQLYTYETLNIISKEYKTNNIILIMGSDNLDDFDKWYNYEEMLKKYSLLVFARDEKNINDIINSNDKLKKHENRICIFDNMNMPVSSSDIRERIKKGEDVDKFLPQGIYEYIKNNNLYRI